MERGGFAPKVRVLTQHETQASFETWKETFLFNLTLDGTFELFLEDDISWGLVDVPHRGLLSDDTGPEASRKTARQKAAILNRLLGSIASYAPVISRQFIIKEALSLDQIWHRLRIFYGFRKSGALILDLTTINMEEGESYEACWEKVYAFFMDNLLSPSDGLKHLDQAVAIKETMSPTLLNTAVVFWLKIIHPQLPAVIKQKYTTELRNRTLATLREEISESLDSILLEIGGEHASVSRSTFYGRQQRKPQYRYQKQTPSKPMYSRFKSCPLCEAYNRPKDHFLSECPFLPEQDRRYISRPKSRAVGAGAIEDDEYEYESEIDMEQLSIENKPARSVQLRKVDVASSPYLLMRYGPHKVTMLLDSGAETNLIELGYAQFLQVPITATTTSASLADGSSNLSIVGEVHMIFTKDDLSFKFDALVARKLTDKVIAGIPFLSAHDIYARPSKKTIYVGKREFKYGAKFSHTASIMRVSRKLTLLPGDSLDMTLPDHLSEEQELALEPKIDAASLNNNKYGLMWLQPQIIPVQNGEIQLTNYTNEVVQVNRHEQIAYVRPVTQVPIQSLPTSVPTEEPSTNKVTHDTTDYMNISNDPNNILKQQQKQAFGKLHEELKEVFDSKTLGRYNGASGPLEIVINMGPTKPPSRKGRLPLYNDNTKKEMQDICDSLEGTVLLKPEEMGITCEYLSPSFLVKKPSGKKRLVTAFAEIGSYSKPQPALMPNINTVLRQIGNWSYLIKTDLTSAYWQIPLSKSSMKYTGIATPYKGIRVYGRGAMGMPGTETALEELLCRILGKQLAEGGVTKLADDLYIGGATPEIVLNIWRTVLEALLANGLRLSASKTVICPKSVSILGWTWTQGTIQASTHKVNALAAVDPPPTVSKLRSYIGGVKFLSRVMKNYSAILHPLEQIVAGRESSEKIMWTDSLLETFKTSQSELRNTKSLTIPRKEDQLNIVTDASKTGIAAAMYVIREGKARIAGYFSSKLRKHQEGWLPCELEALSIGAAVTHFSPDIVNSEHQTMVLSDSLPCIQAYGKLCKGQFSTSSRVSTFLSILSRFNTHLLHIKGESNIYSDYASRNAPECTNKQCQVCQFVNDTSESVVRSCSVKDVLQSTAPVPFCSRSGWYELQLLDQSLRRTSASLKQGTKPSRKEVDIQDVKRYLHVAKIARDGLLVVENHSPVLGKTERIIVPRMYIHGLLECLHLKLDHPSKSQLRQVFCRAFYALDIDEAIDIVSKRCHTCLSLSDMPNRFLQQTSTTKPEAIGSNFSADIVKRSGQSFLVLREYISSFTTAKRIPNEKADTLRNNLIVLGSNLIPRSGPTSVIKVDPASSFRGLMNDQQLKRNGIVLELGEPKYMNKNPVAERAIREFHSEVNRLLNGSQHISDEVLARAMSNMNSRIRGEGLSAWELWTHRNQYTNEQIPINDMEIIKSNQKRKLNNHNSSAKFKARGKGPKLFQPISLGSIVYINSDRSKLNPRDRYIVIEVNPDTCKVQKFSGKQLRARPYVVHRADISTIQPWIFKDDEPPRNDGTMFSKKTNNQIQDQTPPMHNEENNRQSETEDISEEEEENQEAYENPHQTSNGPQCSKDITRSSRKVAPPDQFYMEEETDDEENEPVETCENHTTRFGRKVKPPERLGATYTKQ